MKITRVETLWASEVGPGTFGCNSIPRRGTSDSGEVGHNALAAEHVVHEYARRFLLGQDAGRIDHLWTTIYDSMRHFQSGGE